MSVFPILFLVLYYCSNFNDAQLVRTMLDAPALRDVRKSVIKFYMNLNLLGNSLERGKKFQRLQNEIPESEPFFCDAKNGPGKRSAVRPTSVNELRPGDIDIIAAIGDSIFAGNGLVASTILDVAIDNRGMSGAIGGQGTWRKFITLPNILKEFNPQLYGYSLGDALSTDRTSKFNVAEGGAMSRDMQFQAKILKQRMENDPNVNMTNDWKLVTVLMGANDFCSDICFYDDPFTVIDNHAHDLVKTFRYLRDNIPRLMVNYILPPDVSLILDYIGTPQYCEFVHNVECSCLKGRKMTVETLKKIVKLWREKDAEIISRPEFNTNEFTVNLQPVFQNIIIPKLKDGRTDYRYISVDCFHLSQRYHAIGAKGIWSNMLEPSSNKSTTLSIKYETLTKCPTKKFPYIFTRDNGIQL